MFSDYYGQKIYELLGSVYALLESMATVNKYVLYALVFFGFLFVAFKFVNKGWLSL